MFDFRKWVQNLVQDNRGKVNSFTLVPPKNTSVPFSESSRDEEATKPTESVVEKPLLQISPDPRWIFSPNHDFITGGPPLAGTTPEDAQVFDGSRMPSGASKPNNVTLGAYIQEVLQAEGQSTEKPEETNSKEDSQGNVKTNDAAGTAPVDEVIKTKFQLLVDKVEKSGILVMSRDRYDEELLATDPITQTKAQYIESRGRVILFPGSYLKNMSYID